MLLSGHSLYTFARVLGFTNTDISARAVAQKNQWMGEALPFINLDDKYETEGIILQGWEKVQHGKMSFNDPKQIIEVYSEFRIEKADNNSHITNGYIKNLKIEKIKKQSKIF